jgi:hypothetical protein
MKQYSVKNKCFRDHRKTRCINPRCGKWVELYREKNCPDAVCPLCGSKQRAIVELCSLRPENLAAFSHLLHEAQPAVSLSECRKQCRGISKDNPYRLQLAGRPERINPLIQKWNLLGGTAVACLARETSRRPIVLLHSYNRRHETEYASLLYEAIQKSDHASLTFGETVEILHRINGEEKPVRLCFVTDFDRIDAWVDAWRKLGGTAVRSGEYRTVSRPPMVRCRNTWNEFASFFP